MQTPYKIAGLQMQYAGSPEASLKKACAMLEEAAGKGAALACLPELFLTDYFCQGLDASRFDLAEPVDGPTTQAFQKIARARKLAIINSIFEKAGPGLYYNTVVVIDRDGDIKGTYRKMHIPHDPLFEEKYYFTPGDLGFKAHDTSLGKLGTLICWDQWYPEGARLTAMQGADILFYPTAIGWHPSEKAEWGDSQVDSWVTIQRAHAIANGVFVCAVNRIGHETPPQGGDGLTFFGNSFICDPYGRILAQGSHDKEEILLAEINPALIEHKRRNWPFFRDRRVDAYGGLMQRWLQAPGA
jgi:N-carbamoylputrescine amidase